MAIDLHIQSIDLLNKGIDPNVLKNKRDQFYGSILLILQMNISPVKNYQANILINTLTTILNT